MSASRMSVQSYINAGNNYYRRLKKGESDITLRNLLFMLDEINLFYDSRIMNVELRSNYSMAEYWKSEKIKWNEAIIKGIG